MDTLQVQFAAQIKTWIGVPYLHRGTSRDGCDCTGIIIGCLRELGYLIEYQLPYYPPDWNLHGGAGDYIRPQIALVADEISKSETSIGDIVLMHFGKCIAHAGVLVENDLIVHCYVTAGKCGYGRLKSSQWAKRWTTTFRLSETKLRSNI